MNVKVVGTALIVTSSLTAVQMEQAKHYCPDALKLTDEEGNTIYRVDKAEEASVGKYGTIFNGVSADGKLQATVIIPDAEDKRDFVSKNYGIALANLANAEPVIIDTIQETIDIVGSAVADMEVQ